MLLPIVVPPVDAAAIVAQATAATRADVVTSWNGQKGPVSVVIPPAPDLSSYATTAQMTALQATIPSLVGLATTSALSAVQASIPTKGTGTPPAETVAGNAGSAGQWAPWNHSHPRITRAARFTVGANGSLSGSWADALSAAPVMVYTPTLAGSKRVTCQNATAPTATTFSATCFLDQAQALTTAIITVGISVGPAYAPAGSTVDVIALLPSQ